MVVVYILVAIVLLYLIRYLKHSRKANAHPLLKRANGKWILGNAYDFMPENFLKTLKDFPLIYGPFVECYLLTKRVLLITDVAIGKEVLLKRPKKFGRLKALNYPAGVMNITSSLFYSSGSVWNRVRKSCVPSFSHLNIANKVSDIAKEILSCLETLKADPNLAQKTTDMQHECFQLTVRVITVVAFGLPTNHPLVAYFLGPFQNDVRTVFAFSGASAMFPFPRFLWKYSPKYKLELEGREATERVKSEGKKITDYKRQLVKEGKLTKSQCMVDSMILNEGNSEKSLTDHEIIVNVRGFYTAGADTTAITLTWAAYNFALYPEVAERVRQEAMKLLFRNQSPKNWIAANPEIDLNVFQEMVYTNAVLNEILRVNSPAVAVAAELEEENDEYQFSNGITVRSGEVIYVNTEGMQTDANLFEDPFAFNPDRWLTKDSAKLLKMQDAFLPFGFGPRMCPGMGLSIHESLLAVAMFAVYFKFSLNCPKEEIVRVTNFVAGANKMPMILTPRTGMME
jgi:cytochrome P450